MRCSCYRLQAHARESGLEPAKIADAMHDAGVAAAKSTQIPPDQAGPGPSLTCSS